MHFSSAFSWSLAQAHRFMACIDTVVHSSISKLFIELLVGHSTVWCHVCFLSTEWIVYFLPCSSVNFECSYVSDTTYSISNNSFKHICSTCTLTNFLHGLIRTFTFLLCLVHLSVSTFCLDKWVLSRFQTREDFDEKRWEIIWENCS